MKGMVVDVVRRSGRVVEGLSACCCLAPPAVLLLLPPSDWRKFCTRALVSWGAEEDAL